MPPRAGERSGGVADHEGIDMQQDIFVRASATDYIAWLRGYLAAGGTITHAYDYEFARADFLVAHADFTIGGECGADARPIITASRDHFRGGELGHNKIYILDGYEIVARLPWVPVYTDPAFADVPGYDEAVEAEAARERAHAARERAREAERDAMRETSDLSRFAANS